VLISCGRGQGCICRPSAWLPQTGPWIGAREGDCGAPMEAICLYFSERFDSDVTVSSRTFISREDELLLPRFKIRGDSVF